MALVGTTLSVLLLLVTATGVGIAARRALFSAPARDLGLSVSALVGLCFMAAVMPNLFLLGLPRHAVLGGIYCVAGFGWFRWGKRELDNVDRRAAMDAGLLALALASPIVIAATRPPIFNDAVLIWWPKVVEVARGEWPYVGQATLAHVNPGYPRGMAWLTNAASPASIPDPQLMQMVSLLWTWLTAVAMVATGRMLGGGRSALLVALLFVLLPDVARHACSGMSDLAIAGAVLLASIGLTMRRTHPEGFVIAGVAAIGAHSMKEEGAVVSLVVGAFFVFDLWRRPANRLRTLRGIALFPILVPFWLVRSSSPQTRMTTLSTLLNDPEVLFLRCVAVVEHMFRFVMAPDSVAFAGEGVAIVAVSWAGFFVLVSLVLLIPRPWPRPMLATPAVLMLPAAALAYITTGIGIRWHISTTIDRLMIELVPTIALAGFLRMAPGTETATLTPTTACAPRVP